MTDKISITGPDKDGLMWVHFDGVKHKGSLSADENRFVGKAMQEVMESVPPVPVDTISPEFNCEMDAAITYLQDDLRKNGHDLVWKDRYIATLIKGYQTERTMHYAWEKRAYETENTVDTISIKREVLQGVRESLKWIAEQPTSVWNGCLQHEAEQALATLDAVFSEGE